MELYVFVAELNSPDEVNLLEGSQIQAFPSSNNPAHREQGGVAGQVSQQCWRVGVQGGGVCGQEGPW